MARWGGIISVAELENLAYRIELYRLLRKLAHANCVVPKGANHQRPGPHDAVRRWVGRPSRGNAQSLVASRQWSDTHPPYVVAAPVAKGLPMPRQFTHLKALAGEIDKLAFEIDDEARQIIEGDVKAVRDQKKLVYDKARGAVGESRDALAGVGKMLDAVDQQLSNSGEKKDPT